MGFILICFLNMDISVPIESMHFKSECKAFIRNLEQRSLYVNVPGQNLVVMLQPFREVIVFKI